MRSVAVTLILAAVVVSVTARVGPPLDAHTDVTVATYNTYHAQDPNKQVAILAVENPPPGIVVAQEILESQLDDYVLALERTIGGDWSGYAARHCAEGMSPTCISPESGESVMVFSRYPVDQVERRLLWYVDRYWVARAALRIRVTLPGGTKAHVWSVHLPTSASARLGAVSELRAWSASFANDLRLLGGDFNARPTDPEITGPAGMTVDHIDAWSAAGSGNGNTNSNRSTGGPRRRIDYWFSRGPTTSNVVTAYVPSHPDVGDINISDHRPLVARYRIDTSTAR